MEEVDHFRAISDEAVIKAAASIGEDMVKGGTLLNGFGTCVDTVPLKAVSRKSDGHSRPIKSKVRVRGVEVIENHSKDGNRAGVADFAIGYFHAPSTKRKNGEPSVQSEPLRDAVDLRFRNQGNAGARPKVLMAKDKTTSPRNRGCSVQFCDSDQDLETLDKPKPKCGCCRKNNGDFLESDSDDDGLLKRSEESLNSTEYKARQRMKLKLWRKSLSDLNGARSGKWCLSGDVVAVETKVFEEDVVAVWNYTDRFHFTAATPSFYSTYLEMNGGGNLLPGLYYPTISVLNRDGPTWLEVMAQIWETAVSLLQQQHALQGSDGRVLSDGCGTAEWIEDPSTHVQSESASVFDDSDGAETVVAREFCVEDSGGNEPGVRQADSFDEVIKAVESLALSVTSDGDE